ncbi:hypothetical protein B0H34DRAFT_814479 [Crassisporium funariophilum]|nr:hypothetical protein B0H34DRAFT_814479 [Crassisporium funariophilum]
MPLDLKLCVLVISNTANNEYVMWFHSDTSKSSVKPLGAESRDMGLYLDGERSFVSQFAQLLTQILTDDHNNQKFKISRLDADYYTVVSQTSVLSGSTLKAPGIIKRNGIYYLFASHTSGWDPNPNKFFTAPLEHGRTSDSCSRRVDPQPCSRIASGTSYEAEGGTISGTATSLSSSSFSGDKISGSWVCNGGSITINGVQGIGTAQWVSLYYANGDSSWRNTTVSVNGGASVLVDQLNTGGGGVVLSVPVRLNLKSGANSITFSANQKFVLLFIISNSFIQSIAYAADLDKIIVYTAV